GIIVFSNDKLPKWHAIVLSGLNYIRDEYNVIIHVGKGDNVKTFQAHSLILRARCSYYKTALSKQWAKKEGDSSVLRQPNVTPKVFEIILKDIIEVLEILAAADELLLTDLLDFIQDHLIETKSEWLHSYILKVYQTTLSHDSCSILHEFILATISSDPELLFKSPDFLKDESHGPCFGDKDLWMQGDFSHPDSCSSKEDDYETWITKHRKFSVSEYEVFKIIKK
ncbi:17048_t:CDS:2, partial [Cetraspora pellucida]